MKWYSVKKYKPSAAVTDCFVRTSGGCLWIASNETYKGDAYKFMCNSTDEYINEVTHFCIPDPIEIDD